MQTSYVNTVQKTVWLAGTAAFRWQLSLWLQIDNTAPMNGTTAFEPFLSSCKSNQGEKTQNVGMTLGNPFLFSEVLFIPLFL